MTTFAYSARDQAGQMISGTLEAASVNDASQQLRAEGKFIVKLNEAKRSEVPADAVKTLKQSGSRVKRDDVIQFAHQMAVMIDTGVNLGEALDSLREQCKDENFRVVLDDVTHCVQGGGSFSEALQRHPKVFPHLMVSMMEASEVSGTMGQMLDRISQYMTKERNTIRSVRGAMIYPCIMLLAAGSVTVFLLAFVLPRFGSIYLQRGAVLPGPTRLLLFLSEMTTAYWFVWVGLVFGSVIAAFVALRRPWGQRGLDWLLLNAPVVGNLFRQLCITRSMRTMGTMIQAGVPMLDVVRITRQITQNSYYDELWMELDDQLRQGAMFSRVFLDSPLVPGSLGRMISSGEKAGRLGPVMEKIAEFTESDFDDTVKRTTQFIEPAMVSFMGALIGFVAIALLLPIFSMGSVVAG